MKRIKNNERFTSPNSIENQMLKLAVSAERVLCLIQIGGVPPPSWEGVGINTFYF